MAGPRAAFLLAALLATAVAELCSNGANTLRELGELAGINIGVGTRIDYLEEYPAQAELVKREFNMLATDDEMKMNILMHPHDLAWDFEKLDKMVEFAKDNNLKIRGHTLFYHLAIPDKLRDWDLTQEEWREWATDYICTVMERYKGVITEYDVVNEVFVHPEFDDVPAAGLRDTFFKEKLGDDYVQFLFEEAHKCDPDATLYLNDFLNEHENSKMGYILATVEQWVAEGVPIHGIGMQAHVSYFHDTEIIYENAFRRYDESGLLQALTEFDAFHKCENATDFYEHQAEIYYTLVKLALRFPNSFKSIVVWGLNDNFSWVKNNPLFPCKGQPTLFDTDNKKKLAYYAFNKALCEATGGTPGEEEDEDDIATGRTPEPDTTPGPGGDDDDDDGGGDDTQIPTCFPGDSRVLLADGSERLMRDLQVGDKVRTGANAGDDAEVFFFSHKAESVLAAFTTIVSGSYRLRLSGGHMLEINGALKKASEAKPGDKIISGDGLELSVDSVSLSSGTGLYAPHTLGSSGSLIVDGVIVSEFTSAVHPLAARVLLAPLKAAYRLGLGQSFSVLPDAVRTAAVKLAPLLSVR